SARSATTATLSATPAAALGASSATSHPPPPGTQMSASAQSVLPPHIVPGSQVATTVVVGPASVGHPVVRHTDRCTQRPPGPHVPAARHGVTTHIACAPNAQ